MYLQVSLPMDANETFYKNKRCLNPTNLGFIDANPPPTESGLIWIDTGNGNVWKQYNEDTLTWDIIPMPNGGTPTANPFAAIPSYASNQDAINGGLSLANNDVYFAAVGHPSASQGTLLKVL